jgi:hypothetical protein
MSDNPINGNLVGTYSFKLLLISDPKLVDAVSISSFIFATDILKLDFELRWTSVYISPSVHIF